MKKILFIAFAAFCLTACVSQKKFDRLQSEFDRVNRNYNDLNIQSKEIDAQRKALEKEKAELDQKIAELKALQDRLSSEHKIEKGDLQSQLAKERAELDRLQQEFEDNNKRLIELQQMLAKKDEAVKALRQRVAHALLGFEGKGLTVTQKNGKVYVSLEEQLLFKSGDWNIEARGAQALKELATVLAANPDINVMVEGHTDDVPYRGTGALQGNWDLSVKRATTVVKTLLDGTGVDPKQITAAGRGEYLPVDDDKTTEARRKNRRTEIILTPKLDELLEILEAN